MTLIYKILTKAQWHSLEETGEFAGAPVDINDGYIHFSDTSQVEATCAKHFAGQTDLWLVAIDDNPQVKWEISRGGALFPHLYGVLKKADITLAKPLPFFFGRHVFTGLI